MQKNSKSCSILIWIKPRSTEMSSSIPAHYPLYVVEISTEFLLYCWDNLLSLWRKSRLGNIWMGKWSHTRIYVRLSSAEDRKLERISLELLFYICTWFLALILKQEEKLTLMCYLLPHTKTKTTPTPQKNNQQKPNNTPSYLLHIRKNYLQTGIP